MHAVLMDILGLGVLIVGRERHRQERVRARSDRPRPPARGRRHGRDPPPRRNDSDRHLSRADAPPHGAARPRRHQRQGSVRHRLDAIVEARRAGRAARTLGAGPRVRAARPRRRVLRDPRPAGAADPDAGRAGPQRRDPRRGGGPQPAAAGARPSRGARAGRAPRADAARRRRCRPTTRTTRKSSPEGRGDDASGEAGGRRGGRRAAGGLPTGARRQRAGQPFIVLTGLSGSGKSQAIRALEDLGYFCVDNLPTTLIPTLAKLSLRGGGDIEKVAIVVDVREGNFLSSFPEGLPAGCGRCRGSTRC